jgi:hypothetical protein
MSSSSVMQLALEDSKRQLEKADEKRKATAHEVLRGCAHACVPSVPRSRFLSVSPPLARTQVEALLKEIEVIRSDMFMRSEQHAVCQSRCVAADPDAVAVHS